MQRVLLLCKMGVQDRVCMECDNYVIAKNCDSGTMAATSEILFGIYAAMVSTCPNLPVLDLPHGPVEAFDFVHQIIALDHRCACR